MMKTLKSLSPGASGIIASVSNRSGAVKRRLIDMGLTPGTKITVKKVAPFGDPIQVSLRGYELSLRKEDAAQISLLDETAVSGRKPASYKKIYSARRLDNETLLKMRRSHEHELSHHIKAYDPAAHDRREMKIALAGNPNSGKTTLFNALTGSNQYVGNWPGVTVEKKEGKASIEGKTVTIVDLPGIYSLSPYSMEEIVTRDFIINEKPDAIINIVDATNIERNLNLTVQLLELERPMVLALNFMDEIVKKGDKIDVDALSRSLGIPVVAISARTGENLDELLRIAHRQMHEGFSIEPDDLYDDFTHEIHHEMGELIHDFAYAAGIPAHWAAIKLLEGDRLVEASLALDGDTRKTLDGIIKKYEASSTLGDRETLITDSRYRFIERVVSCSVTKGAPAEELSISDKIDKIATHRIFALPLFLLMMLVMFGITFGPLGSLLSDLVAELIENRLSPMLEALLSSASASEWLISLIVNGILQGVGGVLTFLPQIALLFFFLSLLEDSGYMSRAAFIMDRLLHRFGLSGKAFIPMLMGFGCTVPAVMGARTMESEKDRRLTIMLIPFMSCSAKLPIYGLIASAFFGRYAGLVIFSLYLLGMLFAIISGLIFKDTIFAGEAPAFVMELPPYRMPSVRNTLLHVWERVRDFLVRAGTLIFAMSVVLWLLQNFDMSLNLTDDTSKSILGVLGGFIAPMFKPMGFGAWQASVALLTGLVAKEAVVASLSMFYGFSLTEGSSVVASALSGTFTPLSAFSFLVFVLMYVPCVAAVATIRKEMASLKWTFASVGWQLFTAYIISMLVYQTGRLLGLG